MDPSGLGLAKPGGRKRKAVVSLERGEGAGVRRDFATSKIPEIFREPAPSSCFQIVLFVAL